VTNNYLLLIVQFVGLNTLVYLYLLHIFNCKKLKQSRYRPVVAQRFLRKLKVPRFRDNGTGWW